MDGPIIVVILFMMLTCIGALGVVGFSISRFTKTVETAMVFVGSKDAKEAEKVLTERSNAEFRLDQMRDAMVQSNQEWERRLEEIHANREIVAPQSQTVRGANGHEYDLDELEELL